MQSCHPRTLVLTLLAQLFWSALPRTHSAHCFPCNTPTESGLTQVQMCGCDILHGDQRLVTMCLMCRSVEVETHQAQHIIANTD